MKLGIKILIGAGAVAVLGTAAYFMFFRKKDKTGSGDKKDGLSKEELKLLTIPQENADKIIARIIAEYKNPTASTQLKINNMVAELKAGGYNVVKDKLGIPVAVPIEQTKSAAGNSPRVKPPRNPLKPGMSHKSADNIEDFQITMFK